MQSMDIRQVFQALANDRRQQILEWLKDPKSHFPPQVDGDLVKDGVCACSIAEKLGISQPTLSEHMRVLASAGLVQAKRTKKWIFYKRNEAEIRRFKKVVISEI
jgi:DNA-binding transcriptional ArsR family regulator